MVEASSRLGHCGTAHSLAQDDQEQSSGNGILIGELGLPMRKEDRGYDYLGHGTGMRNVVRGTVAEKQVTRHLSIDRVPARGRVEFEKMKDRQASKEGGQTPNNVSVVDQVNASEKASAKGGA